ncbi:MAG: AAA family ATPase [Candidatus Shapirobacteria bacterium]|nr:AAA family ATPase [Candidatus Shapirobacteria bacterium]
MAVDKIITDRNTGVEQLRVADLMPQASLQSPDYFVGTKPEVANKNIESVITVGRWEVAVGENIMVIDPSGQIQPFPESPELLSIMGIHGLIQAAINEQKQYISFTGGHSADKNVLLPKFIKERMPELTPAEVSTLIAKIEEKLPSSTKKFISTLEAEGILKKEPNDTFKTLNIFTSGENSFLMISPDRKALKVTTSEELENWSFESVEITPGTSVVEKTTEQGLKIKKYREGKARIFSADNQQLRVLPDSSPVIDPEDKSTIWYVDNGKVVSLNGEKYAESETEISEAKLPESIKNCQAVNIDPNGNFLIITHSSDNGTKISIVDKKSSGLIEEIDGVGKPPIIDQEGNIIFIDDSKQIRTVVNNFNRLPAGQSSKIAEIQQSRAAELEAKINGLEQLPEISGDIEAAIGLNGSEAAAKTVDEAVAKLELKLWTMVSPELERATSEADIQKLRLQLEAVRNRPEFQQYSVISERIERAMDTKSAQLSAAKLQTGLVALGSQIPTITSLEGSLSLVKELERLQNLRSETNLMLLNPEESLALRQRLKEIETQVGTIQTGFQGELVNQLSTGLEEIGQVLGSVGTLAELEEARNDPVIRQYLERLNLVSDPVKRAEIRQKWGSLLEKRQQEIGSAWEGQNENRKAKAAETAAEIETSFRNLSRNVEGLLRESNGKINLSAWKTGSASVAELRQQIGQLPAEYQEGYLKKIDQILIERQKVYQQQAVGERKEARTKGATVRFGNESFPVYQTPLVHVTPGWIPLTQGLESRQDKGKLVFRSTTGNVWETDETMVMNMDDPKRQHKFDELKQKAELRLNPKRKVPEIPPEMVLTPSQEKTLEQMVKLFRRQLGLNKDLVRENRPKGITIIQGDAGVGKDFSIEVLAAATNREIVSVPCRFSMDPEDVTSEYRFNPKKGTFRVPSQFAQALSRPGSIVNFIEINTMPPEVAKMLNSVFDFKRKLYFTQGTDSDSVELNVDGVGQEIAVDEDVIFVGTMNYENYIGTRPLPQEFKSRARFMDVDYPPYRVAKDSRGQQERLPVEQTSTPPGYSDMKIAPDEAMILAKQMENLKSLTPDEFSRLWDHKVNRQAGNGADMFDNPDRSKAIESLNQVVAIANKMRQAYRAFQTNEPGAEIFEFVFSIRESQDIVAELAETGSVKEAVAEVVLPKISDAEQRKRARDIIETS